jgi:hypothetical protein
MPPDGRIQRLVAMRRRPIMYYRPQAPQGSTFIKVCLLPIDILLQAWTPCPALHTSMLPYTSRKDSARLASWSLLLGSSLDTRSLYMVCSCKLYNASMLLQKHHWSPWTHLSKPWSSALHATPIDSSCVWQDCCDLVFILSGTWQLEAVSASL